MTACGNAKGSSADSSAIVANGDWNLASNLTEAIYDVRTADVDRSGPTTSFVVSYYNLDDLSGPNLFKQVKFIRTASTTLSADLPEFTGKIDCNAHCDTGTITLQHSTVYSRLNGKVRIQFSRNPLVVFSKVMGTRAADDPVEGIALRAFRSHYLLGGTIEQYQINGGWVRPFEVELRYSTTFLGQTANEIFNFHGTKASGSSVLLDAEDSNSQQSSTLPATVLFPEKDSVEICFPANRALQGIGAYGPSHDSAPLHLCR